MSKNAIKAAAIILLLVFIGAVSFYAGKNYGAQQAEVIVIEGAKNVEQPKEVKADFGLFWEAWDKLKKFHIRGEELSEQDLIYGAIKGLVQSLDDPYSDFLNPSDAQKFIEDVSGNFSGIGAEIGIRKGRLLIISPLKDSPAERAGLKSGDHIIQVDETPTAGLSLDEAVKIIRGEEGTTVTLLISRDEFEETKEFKIVRKHIIVPTLDWEMKDGNVIYVQLYSFNENANGAFYDAILAALQSGARGIILDLRNNPGGYLETAVDLAGWFFDRGKLVVAQESRTGERIELLARGNEALKRIPVVILVNEGSASASEILAGALRDQRGAKIVGKKTFGKGTVQQLQELKDGSVIKLTVAHWLLPSGLLIEGNGLTPDYEVEMPAGESEADPQLEKAMEIIKEEIAKSGMFFLLR